MLKRGFILTLDAVIALIVIILIITTANFFINKSQEDTIAQLNLVRTGNDILTILDYQNSLDNAVIEFIDDGEEDAIEELEEDLNDILPSNYDMKIKIACDNPNIDFELTKTIPNDKFIATGKRVFAVTQTNNIINYCTARFWIWLI